MFIGLSLTEVHPSVLDPQTNTSEYTVPHMVREKKIPVLQNVKLQNVKRADISIFTDFIPMEVEGAENTCNSIFRDRTNGKEQKVYSYSYSHISRVFWYACISKFAQT